eukprot:350432-Amphidinium_carterae.1
MKSYLASVSTSIRPWLFAEAWGWSKRCRPSLVQAQPGVTLYASAQIRFVLPAMDTRNNVAVYCRKGMMVVNDNFVGRKLLLRPSCTKARWAMQEQHSVA